MKRVVLWSAIILVVLGVYYFVGRQPDAKDTLAKTSVVKESERVPPSGALEYRSDAYGFSFFYPEQAKVGVIDEGGGASTITFEDLPNSRGFQLFVLPYSEKQVSEERFQKDIPGGVRKDVKDVTIDGVVGASFTSQSVTLGETYEVWFIHNGYLYELTTLKPLAGFLDEVVSTWKFI